MSKYPSTQMTQRQTLAAIRALGLGADINGGVITVATGFNPVCYVRRHNGIARNTRGNLVYRTRNRQDALQTAHFIATRLPVVCRRLLL